MIYGQKPKYRNNGSLVANSRIERGQTTIPWRTNLNRSRTQITNGVGEIPLIRKGLPLTDKAEGEEIV